MAYQNSSPQIQVGGTTGKAPISHWWPIGLFCSSVLFFVLGGGLLGAWSSSVFCDGYYDICYGNVGEYNGGIACIAIGAILKFAFWVVLIVWCVQRRRSHAPSTVVYVNAQAAAEAGTVAKPEPQATVYSVPQPEPVGIQHVPQYGAAVLAQVPVAEKQAAVRYCGQCGTGTTTPFCSQCGSQVPM